MKSVKKSIFVTGLAVIMLVSVLAGMNAQSQTKAPGDPINVLTPQPGDTHNTGDNLNITWAINDVNIEYVSIDLYRDGYYWDSIAYNVFAARGYYNWYVSDWLEPDVDYDIHVYDDYNYNTQGVSGPFTILNEDYPIFISSPTYGQGVSAGEDFEITWLPSSPGAEVTIGLEDYYSNQLITITESTANDGSYVWSVPSRVEYSYMYVITITDYSGGPSPIMGYSDPFYIITNDQDTYEPDNGPWEATAISMNEEQFHLLEPTSYEYYRDFDWYSFNLTEPTLVNINITSYETYMDFDISIQNDDQQEMFKTTYFVEDAGQTYEPGDKPAVYLPSGNYMMNISGYSYMGYSIILEPAMPVGLLQSPFPIDYEGEWAYRNDMDMGDYLDELIDNLREMGEGENFTIVSSIDLTSTSYMYYKFYNGGDGTHVFEFEASNEVHLDADVTVTGNFEEPGTYDDYADDIPMQEMTIGGKVTADNYLYLGGSAVIRDSDLSITSVHMELEWLFQGDANLQNIPTNDYDYEGYNSTETITYEDHALDASADVEASMDITFPQGYPIIKFPICEGSWWGGETTANVEVNFAGIVDIQGLPQEELDEMDTEFPIILEELDPEYPGHFSETTPAPYAGAVLNYHQIETESGMVDVYGITFSPGFINELGELTTFNYSSNTGFFPLFEMEDPMTQLSKVLEEANNSEFSMFIGDEGSMASLESAISQEEITPEEARSGIDSTKNVIESGGSAEAENSLEEVLEQIPCLTVWSALSTLAPLSLVGAAWMVRRRR